LFLLFPYRRHVGSRWNVWLMKTKTDVATLRPPRVLVHGRKSRIMQDLQQIPCFTN
jgi:hypothetical protein